MFGKTAFGPSHLGDVTQVYVQDSQQVGAENPARYRVRNVAQRSAESNAGDSWSWLTVFWTSAVFLLCPVCAYFTLAALLCNIFAYVDHKAGDDERKQSKLRWAMAVSVTSFVGGCIAVVVVLIVLFAALDAQNWIPPLPDYDYTT